MGGWSWILRLANVIKNEVLLYNIGNYIPYPVISHDGIEYKKEYKYICIYK